MASNTSPVFTKAPLISMAQISTANTARDGTGTIGTVMTGGADGFRVDSIRIHATVTTTAGMVRLFIDDGAANIRLWREVIVTAITVGAAVAAFDAEIRNADGSALLNLPSGYILKASTHNAETFNVIAFGGSYTG